MSVRGDVLDWVVNRLSTNLNYLQDVGKIASPEDFDLLAQNMPSAGVIIATGDNANLETPAGQDMYLMRVQVWFAVRSFTTSEFDDADKGVNEILDDIHAALNLQEPTGCEMPLVIQRDGLQRMDSGLVEWSVEYECGALIGGS
jgi:hypothetical protein